MTYKSRSLSSVSIFALVSNIVIAAPLMAQTVHITAPQTAPNDAALDMQVITGPIAEYSGQLQVSVTGGEAIGNDASAEITIRGIKGDIAQNNSGEIAVEVSGGLADSSANPNSGANAAITIDGVEGTLEIDNIGTISVKGTSQSATTSGTGKASVKVNVKAIDGRLMGDNLGTLSSYAQAGSATANGSGKADASVEGFGTYLDVEGDNIGTIKVEGHAGIAVSASGAADADADITGIDNDLEGANKGLISILAKGGQATSEGAGDVDAYALAIGVKGDAEANSGTILVDADNRNATAISAGGTAKAAADAYGIHGDLRGSNTGQIDVTSRAGRSETTGSATSNSQSLAVGVKGHVEGNSGFILVDADNRYTKATAADGEAITAADAYGIQGDLQVGNTGRISVISSAGQSETTGSAAANSKTLAVGVSGNIKANSGLILVNAAGGDAKATSENGNADASAQASGTKFNLNDDNSGEINIRARAGTASGLIANANAFAFGLENRLEGDNSGVIRVEAFAGTAISDGTTGDGADAIAIAVGVNDYINGSNSGDVIAFGQGGTATANGATSAEAGANVYANNNGLTKDNSGLIRAEGIGGTAKAVGTGHASVTTRVMGIFGALGGTNKGRIFALTDGGTATATGSGNASASAEAIGVYNGIRNTDPNVTTDNLGVVVARATGGAASSVGGNAYGYADVSGLDGSLGGENKGWIEALAQGKTATTGGDKTANAEGLAVGIKGDAEANSGTIFVRAFGGTAQSLNAVKANGAARAFGIGYVNGTTRYGVEGEFTNTNLIEVSATAGTANGTQDKALAYGVVLNGATTLNNSGLIVATATGGAGSEAYQVHAGSNALTVNSYGILFRDDLDENFSGTIQADDPNNVTFNNATLHVHFSNSTKIDVAYEIPDLVAGQDVQQFTQLDGSGVVGHGWSAEAVESSWGTTNQEVIFRYAPEVSSPQLVAQQQRGVIDATQRIGEGLLTDLMLKGDSASGEGLLLAYDDKPASDAENAVADMVSQPHLAEQYGVFYAAPLHLYQQNLDGDLGYSASTTGVVTGYNRVVSPDLIVGANVFYGHSALDFNGIYDQAKEMVDTYGFGVQGAYRKDAVLLTGQSTFYHTSNTYKDGSAQASETYDSQNLLTRVAAKYIWEYGNNTFTPEVGLSHLWHSRGAFGVDNQGVPDVSYDAINNHQFSVDASLGWAGTYQVQEGELKANLRAGLRQILGDGGFKDVLRSGANGKASVTSDIDQTLARASASLEYSKGNFGASVGVLGEYGENTRNTAFFGRVSYKF
ncbi:MULTISPECIES: autotransporter outer membrane beta-barrel domain-containing protein [unclassified Pseudovibrio]|uniref:autotransporter domain-containing protein n=1 Tax=unclassified Pseudovibrio TaxID=2627060 RepID=UPI0007B25FF3|nr:MULTISPECIES: autotransporter outer membrane beta-barrel domain-containing protein [unclassified Pseudovibrio]KZK98689.1 Autotransporter beta-domain protein [Pseudovibrio sp. W74]KZL09181.1 Autotransporter beta-domain protein [Pseudovibrio sp. Ad14]